MEIYDGPYFRLNKSLMKKGGLWPYEENLVKKFSCRLCVGMTIFAFSLPQLYGLYKNSEVNMEKIIEHMALLLFMYGILLKYITAILAENKLKKVYNSIAENWIDLKDAEERRILSDYSVMGTMIAKGYIAYMMMASTFYITLPMTPLLLNVVAPLNETRRPDFIFKGEFPVKNVRDWYLEIFVFDLIGCHCNMYVLITVDGMYACTIEHCTGLFAIIKHRLKLCTNYTDERERDVAYNLIVKIVNLHTKTLDVSFSFTDLLERSYSMSFLLLMGMNMLHCSFVSVLLLLKKSKPLELIRWGGVLCGIVVHVFFVSWPGQKLINHSTDLFDDAYMNDWYKISRKSKDLLRFMKMRCLKPCQLTAGGIYVMNLANFVAIIKTSGSYITVFASFT